MLTSFFGISSLSLFCLTVLLLNATPGPDTAYIVGRSVAQGRSAGMMSAFGITAGCLIHATLSAFGLTALLAASASSLMLIKLAGGGYLIYLGLKMLLKKGDAVTTKANSGAARTHSTIFLQALMTNVLNPKVILFFLSFFPLFVKPDSPHKILAFLLLGSIFASLSLCWNSGTALLAGTVSRHASNNPHIKLWLERTVGAAFIALGVKLAFTKS
ncbi:LysE family translocator [Glaciimonas immobilis]|uniref:Threonine/homoserine/homoserine lactone efflux protein n=1 Tax=Glaciimonas immobilis TaxID=728004 RepID=A0A840RUP1_9BURK|nr:LysE family translocator [Glaciimonas immobilis]KAF3999772.1 LysE family translocator [Glaciimonas immobilis]MBB5200240.1 threonine/homoserine/homoserine lactone efflux protein [Glaciimonas immobilis]